jgi:hypothetical protein
MHLYLDTAINMLSLYCVILDIERMEVPPICMLSCIVITILIFPLSYLFCEPYATKDPCSNPLVKYC